MSKLLQLLARERDVEGAPRRDGGGQWSSWKNAGRTPVGHKSSSKFRFKLPLTNQRLGHAIRLGPRPPSYSGNSLRATPNRSSSPHLPTPPPSSRPSYNCECRFMSLQRTKRFCGRILDGWEAVVLLVHGWMAASALGCTRCASGSN